MAIAEFAYTGGTPALDNTTAASSSSSLAPTTGTISVSGTGPDLLIALRRPTARSGTTCRWGRASARSSIRLHLGDFAGCSMEYAAGVTSSEVATFSMSSSDVAQVGGCSIKLNLSAESFTASPSTIPANHAGHITPSETFTSSPTTIPANHAGHIALALSGTGTSWTGSPFSISGVAGACWCRRR